VTLTAAKIDGDVEMTGASFDGTLSAIMLQAGGSLFMSSERQNKTSFKDVYLGGAKVRGQISMYGASFDGTLDANSLQAGGDLLVSFVGQNKASFKDLDLRGAKITGHIFMEGASFDGTLHARFLQAGGNLFMDNAHFAREVDMVFAHVGGNLDLRGATLAGLDLSGASVNGDFRLGGPPPPWTGKNGAPGDLNLHNTQVGNLTDAEDAWPETRQRGASISMGSLSIISADLKEKPNRKCARGEWTGGTIGRGSILTTALVPTRNSPPH
jgi:uncharacterized protein YjbI with pentapeptide repeats